jgi:hypothetical protein
VYLARYSDSPVGAFDELVVLAGLVWNPPTSCAWAQRVYVSNKAARNHGLLSVGLPSRMATFSQSDATVGNIKESLKGGHRSSWWNVDFASHNDRSPSHPIIVRNTERGERGLKHSVAELILPAHQKGWGPRVSMQLPNFSGGTVDHLPLLHYTCELNTTVKVVSSMRAVGKYDASQAEDVSTVLKGKPLLCMAFDDMHMTVPKPHLLATGSNLVQSIGAV